MPPRMPPGEVPDHYGGIFRGMSQNRRNEKPVYMRARADSLIPVVGT